MSYYDDHEEILWGWHPRPRNTQQKRRQTMNANEIIIPCRLSYSHIWEPTSINGSEPKYSVCCLISKDDTKTLGRINALVKKVIEDGKPIWGGKIPKKLKLPLRDGDEERDDSVYENMMFLNANSGRMPAIIDRRCQPILDQDEVYSGCYANVKISVYPFNKNGNQGVACGLVAVQKTKDGERLSGSTGIDGFDSLDFDDEEAADGMDYLG